MAFQIDVFLSHTPCTTACTKQCRNCTPEQCLESAKIWFSHHSGSNFEDMGSEAGTSICNSNMTPQTLQNGPENNARGVSKMPPNLYCKMEHTFHAKFVQHWPKMGSPGALKPFQKFIKCYNISILFQDQASACNYERFWALSGGLGGGS